MYAEERQQAVADLVSRRGRVSVTDLAEDFDVTTETVRRDLSTLERAGVLRRVHGGAVPIGRLNALERELARRDEEHPRQKDAIAHRARALLPPAGSTVLLDAGTTTARLAGLIPIDLELTVITHAVPVAARLAGHGRVDLVLLPGRVRTATHAAVGADTVAAVDTLRADVAFLGTNGISRRHGCSTPDRAEAAVKQAIVRAAHRAVVLADASKLDQETTCRFAELSEVDTVVTDDAATTSQQRTLTEAGIEVLIG